MGKKRSEFRYSGFHLALSMQSHSDFLPRSPELYILRSSLGSRCPSHQGEEMHRWSTDCNLNEANCQQSFPAPGTRGYNGGGVQCTAGLTLHRSLCSLTPAGSSSIILTPLFLLFHCTVHKLQDYMSDSRHPSFPLFLSSYFNCHLTSYSQRVPFFLIFFFYSYS